MQKGNIGKAGARKKQQRRRRDQAALGAALLEAAGDGQMKAVLKALKDGADIEAVSNVGRTALHCASQNGHTAIVSALLKAGADIETVANDGWTALRLAAHFERTETLYVLLAAGARMPEDGDGSTAEQRERCLAAQVRHEGMLRVAVPALREYFCDDLVVIIFANAHTRVEKRDLPLSPLQTSMLAEAERISRPTGCCALM